MLNPIESAMVDVFHTIPWQILEVALRTANERYHESNHIAAFISQHIIKERIMKDINISGGLIKTVVLKPAWIERMTPDHMGLAGDDGPFTVYRIPPEARDNLPISGVLGIQYPYNTFGGNGVADLQLGTGGYNLTEQIDQVLNSYTLGTPRNHPAVDLLSGDLVKLCPTQYAQQHWLLTIRTHFDEALTSIYQAQIPVFGKLVLYATQQWCYTNLIIDVDRAHMETGADIGAFKTVLEEYRDARTLYDETLVAWRGASMLPGAVRRRLLKYQL